MKGITTFLWFDKNAEEAVNFYISIFKNSKVRDVMRWGDVGPGPKGSVLCITFELNGQEFMAMNGGPQYQFNPSISLLVNCETQEEIDYYWGRLTEGGKEVQCGWLRDKYGLSWQIAPPLLMEMLRDKDIAKANRVMAAMVQMVKLDLPTLKKAYEGGNST